MSKKKKKKSSIHSSVLDAPVLGSKDQPEKTDEAPEAEAPEALSEAETGTPEPVEDPPVFEDDSISDLPAAVSGDERVLSDDGGEADPGEQELEDDFPDEEDYLNAPLPLVDRLIQYASITLSVFMLGASIVFWFVMLRYLALCPYVLADPTQIKTILISCAAFSAVITAVQHYLRRPVSPERWLVCLCLSCALATVTAITVQTLVRRIGFTFADLPLAICCCAAGSALPSALFTGLRLLILRFRGHLRSENAKDWETVRGDVLSLTDFGRM